MCKVLFTTLLEIILDSCCVNYDITYVDDHEYFDSL